MYASNVCSMILYAFVGAVCKDGLIILRTDGFPHAVWEMLAISRYSPFKKWLEKVAFSEMCLKVINRLFPVTFF